MMMPHPLIPVSLPPASVTMAMSQMNHLSTIANMAAAAQGQSLPSRMVTSVIKVNQKTERAGVNVLPFLLLLRLILDIHFVRVVLWLLGLQERVPDSPSPAPSLEDHRRPGSHPSSHRSSSVSSSPAHTESSSDRIRKFEILLHGTFIHIDNGWKNKNKSQLGFTDFQIQREDLSYNLANNVFFFPFSLQQHTTTVSPWTKLCLACHPTSYRGLKRETWPTTWVMK